MEVGNWERSFIEQRRVARLATVDGQDRPHIVPIVYAFDGVRLLQFSDFHIGSFLNNPHQVEVAENVLHINLWK